MRRGPASRPAISQGCSSGCEAYGGGGLLAARAADTLKQAQPLATPGEVTVARTVERAELWRALTPQMFRYAALRRGARCGARRRAVPDR